VHDEGDQVIKSENLTNEEVRSQALWNEMVNLVEDINLPMKRVFVSATPESCLFYQDIKSRFRYSLEVPSDYVGWDKIEVKDLNLAKVPRKGDVRKEVVRQNYIAISDILEAEVGRINKAGTYEAILVCTSNKKDDHSSLMTYLRRRLLPAAINTYNQNNIHAYIPKEYKVAFESALKKDNIEYERSARYFSLPKREDAPISKYYSILKSIGVHAAVTIGMNVMTRGVSFVSSDKKDPLTATTMLYSPGAGRSTVSDTQTIGRITGVAAPLLHRTLYTSAQVLQSLNGYARNQQRVSDAIRDGTPTTKLTKNVMTEAREGGELVHYPRRVERAAFKTLNEIGKGARVTKTDTADLAQVVVRLYKSRTRETAYTAKALWLLYDPAGAHRPEGFTDVLNMDNVVANGISREILMRYITALGSRNPQGIYQCLCQSSGRNTIAIFTMRDDKTGVKLQQRARALLTDAIASGRV
jgi:hypothetical protein